MIILIYGDSGSGKTTLVNTIKHYLHSYKYWHLDRHYAKFFKCNSNLALHWDGLPKKHKNLYFDHMINCMKPFENNLAEGYYLKDYHKSNAIRVKMRNKKMYYKGKLIGDKDYLKGLVKLMLQ